MKVLARGVLFACFLWSSAASAAPPPPPPPPPPELTEQTIDAADFEGWRARVDAQAQADAAAPKSKRKPRRESERPPDPFLIRAQILLDRAHASPGAIDGWNGDNFRKAVHAFRAMRGLRTEGEIDTEVWRALSEDQGKATKVYEITAEDVKARYEPKLPSDYAKLAKLKWLGFRDPVEMLAERFHMFERLIRTLNPRADFTSPGQRILVADPGADPEGKVSRIVVDKKAGELRAYGDGDALILVAPATIGSPDTPSPSGKMVVNGSYPDPHYKYDPKKNFQQGKNTRKLDLPPGPNGPVGSMWIDLSKPTYGIHGTPDPEKISKSASHGCVRLTNWDAGALGRLIEPKKTSVEFQ
jgi:lipoprotein-anchoring transpeptidase ErfK/SrfK